jgi:hydrogenase maturation protease
MQTYWRIVSLGNPVVSDDRVGCLLVRRLREASLEQWIHDLGSDHLKIQGLQPYPQHLILLDTLRNGARPGSLYHLSKEILLQSPTIAVANGFGLKGTLRLLWQTDDVFCKTERE